MAVNMKGLFSASFINYTMMESDRDSAGMGQQHIIIAARRDGKHEQLS